jgi:hypothetical protein
MFDTLGSAVAVPTFSTETESQQRDIECTLATIFHFPTALAYGQILYSTYSSIPFQNMQINIETEASLPLVSKPDALLDHLGALHICLSI